MSKKRRMLKQEDLGIPSTHIQRPGQAAPAPVTQWIETGGPPGLQEPLADSLALELEKACLKEVRLSMTGQKNVLFLWPPFLPQAV